MYSAKKSVANLKSFFALFVEKLNAKKQRCKDSKGKKLRNKVYFKNGHDMNIGNTGLEYFQIFEKKFEEFNQKSQNFITVEELEELDKTIKKLVEHIKIYSNHIEIRQEKLKKTVFSDQTRIKIYEIPSIIVLIKTIEIALALLPADPHFPDLD